MLNRQSLAALRPASFQDCPSVLGRHPGPEPVLFRASAVVRLISSLRHSRTPWNSPESENLEFKGIAESCQKQINGSSKGGWRSVSTPARGLFRYGSLTSYRNFAGGYSPYGLNVSPMLLL